MVDHGEEVSKRVVMVAMMVIGDDEGDSDDRYVESIGREVREKEYGNRKREYGRGRIRKERGREI